jgi:hypothetical protein
MGEDLLMQQTTKIQQLFEKDIHRSINGVIQAGQSDPVTVQNELEEYVMTKEVMENFASFYQTYCKRFEQPSNEMAAWISGFFGSGKSHFLKMLSYLLDNKEVKGKKPVEYFLEKTTKEDLLHQMQWIADKPSDAILFNIDSLTSTGGNQKEKIVEVFLRVFNEKIGYSETLWIAEMERQIDEDGKYEQLKAEIQKVSGLTWEELRPKIILKKKSFITAMTNIGYEEETARDLLSTMTKTFEINSKKFARLIQDYCKRKGPEYRLIFLVDEVGQYIGDNSSLMLNLQTVVEDLGEACQGQAWVIVTSQEKIDAVVNLHSTTDFSKIQGRFSVKINLSSANTDEVIKHRLLMKTEVAVETLEAQYDTESQMIKNRLSFDPNTTQFRSGYRSREEFVALYPFVPYQIDLIQKVFHKIRVQGEGGAALSKGERSLLKACQSVAILLANENMKRLATFARFYEPIKNFLASSIKATIYKAEEKAKNKEGLEEFDVEVLKALYMVKSIDEFRSTANNISSLFIDAVDCERGPIEQKVKASLERLLQSMLIEQHADQSYSFLSDEEQEMNREINQEYIDETVVIEKLGKMFYDSIYPQTKYRFQNLHDFDFNKRFDGYHRGNLASSLTLQVFTDEPISSALMKASDGQLIMCLNPEEIAEAEKSLRQTAKIRSYVNRKKTKNSTSSQIKIYDHKQAEASEFEEKAKSKLADACMNSIYCIQGKDHTFAGDVQTQINQAFDLLVRNTYSKIGYIDSPVPVKDEKKEIQRLIREGYGLNLKNHNAYDEILRECNRKANYHEKITLKTLFDQFEGVPYGWRKQDIAALLGVLLFDRKIKLRNVSGLLTSEEPRLADILLKQSEREKVLVEVQIQIDPRIRRDLVAILRDFFGDQLDADTYEDAAKQITMVLDSKFLQPLKQIKNRRINQDPTYVYPGGMVLQKIEAGVQTIVIEQDPEQVVHRFIDVEDQMELWINQLIDLQSFYDTTPIEQFDKAVQFLRKHEADLYSAQTNIEIESKKHEIITILTKEEPYKEIPNLPILMQNLQQALKQHADQVRADKLLQLEQIKKEVKNLEQYYANFEDIVSDIKKVQNVMAEKYSAEIETTDSLYQMNTAIQQIHDTYRQLEQNCSDMEKRLIEKTRIELVESENDSPPPLPEKSRKEISPEDLVSLVSQQDQIEIYTRADLDQFINSLKNKMFDSLSAHTIVIKRGGTS